MKIAYKFLLNILVFGFAIFTFNGVNFVDGLFSLIVGGLIYAGLIYAIDPVLGFFKFPKNFWAYLIVGAIFILVYFILLDAILVGIVTFGIGSIGGGFGPFSMEAISLESKMVTVIAVSIYTLALSLIMEQLGKSK